MQTMREHILEVLKTCMPNADDGQMSYTRKIQNLIVHVNYFNHGTLTFLNNCSNIFIGIRDENNEEHYYFDIYRNKVKIECFDYTIKLKEIFNGLPLTEESYFQYSLVKDTKDWTLNEINAIFDISTKIPYEEN